MKHVSALWRGWPVAGLLLILLWLAAPVARAQAPAWQTVVTTRQSGGGNINLSQANAVATDASGNVYLAGSFRGTVGFGITTLTSIGGSDVYIAKCSSAGGGFVWVQRIGSTADDYATAVAVNGSSVYVTGTFSGPVANAGSTMLVNAGGTNSTNDVFLAKLIDTGSIGSFAWTQRAGGTGNDTPTAVAVAGTSVYLAGIFYTTGTSFGSLSIADTGDTEGFITKLVDAGGSGSFAWAQRLGGMGHAGIAAVSVSGTTLCIAGSFGGAAEFGSTTLVSAGGGDMYLARLTDTGATGTFSWARRAGGTGDDVANAIAMNGANVYVAGVFNSVNADFGSTTLAAAGSSIFVTKLTDMGNRGDFDWARRTGETGYPRVTALAAKGPSLYMVGWFGGNTLTFDNTTLTNTPQGGPNPQPPYSDAFITKLTDAGSGATISWVKQVGGLGTEWGTGAALSGTSIYMAGWFTSPTMTFDNHIVSNPAYAQVGFLASLTDPTLTATTASHSNLSFTLAPNPARTITTVRLPALSGTASANLTLLDGLGRAVRTAIVALPPAGLRHELSLSGLAPGLYALRVMAGTSSATSRLVVE